MALITCPECGHTVSDKAVFCVSCGYPINTTPPPLERSNRPTKRLTTRRYKRMRFPNGFGSIRQLSGNRRKAFAVYPAVTDYKDNGTAVMPKAIGYYETYEGALAALNEYNRGNSTLYVSTMTFAEVYEAFYKEKFTDSKKKLSISSQRAVESAYNNCTALHDKVYADLRKADFQSVIDKCTLKHASLELIRHLYRSMAKYALENDIVKKDYTEFVTINIPDDDEVGEPFSQKEIDLLWKNSSDKDVQTILIMIYSGFRIKAYASLEINVTEGYFKGGVKTKASKDRLVPIHSLIKSFVSEEKIISETSDNYRNKRFTPTLERLGILYAENGKKHTPHDTRHTFSWLCDIYGVDQLSKHLLMGHTITGDVETKVYSHRSFENLKSEIEKIKRKPA